MRWLMTLVALVALAPAAQAQGVLTFGEPGAPSATVTVDAAGNARVERDIGGLSIIVRDREAYSIGDNGAVPWATVQRDRIAAYDAARPSLPASDLRFAKRAGGAETVNGIAGQLWRLTDRQGSELELVMSDDPRLAPFAPAMRAILAEAWLSLELRRQPGFMAAVEAILARGTLVRLGSFAIRDLRLGPVDPARFRLPLCIVSGSDSLDPARRRCTVA